MSRLFEQHIDQLRAEVEHLMREPGDFRPGLERLLARIDALASTGAELAQIRAREVAQVSEVLEVLISAAGLDFRNRAPVHGDGALDALAQVANMLCEELEVAQHAMASARETAESATLAKSQFLAQMSHEIRTPLTALLGFADLLAAPAISDSERLNYAMIVRRNGDHLLSVINDILDLSRIEAGRLAVERIACSPAQVLGEVASLMEIRATERGLGFEAALATPIPATILCDPTRLRQILLNLVGNAIKFTRHGSVRMVARLDADRLIIEIVDTGIGIAPEQRARLFQPFAQGDQSMSRRFGGSGLGLAISAALVEALGGRIAVDSGLDRGSTFRIAFPVPADGPLVDTLAPAGPVPDDGRGRGTRFAGRVLVVEDGLDNQVLVTTLLRGYGLTVGVAGDGHVAVRGALDAWRNGTPFDVVLMDMQMPIMDGYRATQALREAGYPGPIIALTAHAMAGERERCLEAGCTDYIKKPIDRAELVAALRRCVPAPEDGHPGPMVSTFADDPDMVEIIARFVASLPDRIAALRVEAASPGAPGLSRLVHQLKGAAGGYGFAAISEAAADVEHAIRDGGGEGLVNRALDVLAGVCARARSGSA